jgi:hypothetical protein
LTVPIYEGFRYDKEQSNPFFGLEHFKGTLDCYCHGCGRHTVFNRMGEPKYREHHHRSEKRRSFVAPLFTAGYGER